MMEQVSSNKNRVQRRATWNKAEDSRVVPASNDSSIRLVKVSQVGD